MGNVGVIEELEFNKSQARLRVKHGGAVMYNRDGFGFLFFYFFVYLQIKL